MTQIPRQDLRAPSRLALAGPGAALTLVLGMTIADLSWPGYDHRIQNISDLGGTEAPEPLILNAAFVLFGLLTMVFAIPLGRIGGARTRVLAWLVGYLGITSIVQGGTPCTPGCRGGTVLDQVHGLATITGLLAFSAATVLVWRCGRTTPGWSTAARFSAWTGILVMVSLGAWLVAATVDPDALHAGVLQRLAIAAVLTWVAVVGFHIAQRPAWKGRPTSGR